MTTPLRGTPVGVDEFAETLCARMCPRCRQGHIPTLDRGVWSHVFYYKGVAVKPSMFKAGPYREEDIEAEQICRAGEVRQLLEEVKSRVRSEGL